MQSFLKTVRSNMIIQAILFIVLGIVLVIMPGISLLTIVYLFASIFAVSGVVSLIGYFRAGSASYHLTSVLTTGIFSLILAVISFMFPVSIAGMFSLCLGIILVLCGVANAIRSFELRNAGGNAWVASMIFSIIIALGGFVVVWNPFGTTVLMVIALGGFMIANGVMGLILEHQFHKMTKN